ncbi:MAG: 50S ribosomal protein L1 [bacterium]
MPKKAPANKKAKLKVYDYDKTKSYNVIEAIELVKKFSNSKFDASVEAHFRLGIDVKKGDQQIRAAVSLPHGTGKTVKVAAFVPADKEADARAAGADVVGGEELIDEIKKTEKTDFQVAIATPDMMRLLAPIAKILGTRGLMPSPKNDTVTVEPAKAIAEIKKGKISFKNDDGGIVHMSIGKTSFEATKISENLTAVVALLKKIKPAKAKGVYIKSVTICSTMGPGIKVTL